MFINLRLVLLPELSKSNDRYKTELDISTAYLQRHVSVTIQQLNACSAH